MHGRHGVPELPREYQCDQSPRHQTTIVDSGNNEDARSKQGGHKHRRCRHLKGFGQNLKRNPGVSSDCLRHRCRQQERPAFRSALYLTNSPRLARSASVRPRMPHLTLLNTCAMTAVSPLIVAARNVNCHLHHQHSCHVLQLMVTTRRVATNSDEVMVKLIEIIESGMPEFRHLLPTELRPYHQYRDSHYTVDGVVMYNERIVIPPSLCSDVLESLHAAHQGVSSMISRAEHSVFWTGIIVKYSSIKLLYI